MNIIEEARSILESSGYRTALASAADTCHFEDQSVLGAVFVHETVAAMLERWQESQDRFLGSNSRNLRNDPVKAWNIYTVHLTSDRGTSAEATRAFNIEHDFRGTRKVIRTGVANRSDVRESLLPLLGLQHNLTLTRKNISQRMSDRLALASPALAALVGSADEEVVLSDLMEEP